MIYLITTNNVYTICYNQIHHHYGRKSYKLYEKSYMIFEIIDFDFESHYFHIGLDGLKKGSNRPFNY